jgi:hypothetical protein
MPIASTMIASAATAATTIAMFTECLLLSAT